MLREWKVSLECRRARSVEGGDRIDRPGEEKGLESISYVIGSILFLTKNVQKNVMKEVRPTEVLNCCKPWKMPTRSGPEAGREFRQVDSHTPCRPGAGRGGRARWAGRRDEPGPSAHVCVHTHVHRTHRCRASPLQEPRPLGRVPPLCTCPALPAPLVSGCSRFLLRPDQSGCGGPLRGTQGSWEGGCAWFTSGCLDPVQSLAEPGLLWEGGGSLGNQQDGWLDD